MVKIGDKVRFLNAVGGGTVKSFKNKDIVMVEEADGFQTPVLVRECVVIETNSSNYTVRNVVKPAEEQAAKQPLTPQPEPKKEKYTVAEELPGKERLNVYLAYLPMDIKNVGNTTYETFLINDSNYYLMFNYMSRDNNAWHSRCHEVIEPNTQLFLEEFSKEQINDLERICVQLIAFKKGKPYSLKNSYSVELHIDGIKFYKVHCFRENEFFEDDALIYPVIRNDEAARELLVSASDIQEAMTGKDIKPRPKRARIEKKDPLAEIIEVDLHINQLVDNTAGLNNADMLNLQLDKFREVMDANKNKKGQKIVFIHGKGEGVLRKSLLDELKLKYKSCSVQDASFREYGFGATLVTIR